MLKKLQNFLITTFIGGVVVILPITLFIILLRLIIGFINRLIEPLSNLIEMEEQTNEIVVDLISLAIIIGFCFIIGLFVRTRIGRGIIQTIENELLLRLPLYGTIKETIQQFTGAKKTPFSQVVLVDPFNTGTMMTGFVTDELEGIDYVTVFVPTAPNPTNGFVFHIHRKNIQFVKMPTEEAMRTIIGMGVGSTKFFEKKGKIIPPDITTDLKNE